jgi:ABC-2 type transport system permease protein
MFKSSFLFELTYRLKSASTWLCFIALFLMSYREMLAGEWDLLIQSGRVARNSPYTVYYLFMYYTFWAATVGCALMIPTLLRDLKSGTAELLYSFPIQSKQYFLGKYCASMLIFILVMSSVAFGFITMPFVTSALGTHSPTDFISTPWAHIGHAFLLWVLPACFIYGSLTFALTALTGRNTPVYALMMLAVGLFVTITALYGDGAPKSTLVQVLDPLGKVTLEGQIYYWTAEERMQRFLSFEGVLLKNRLIYIGIAALFLLYALAKFDLRKLLQISKNRDAKISSKKAISVNDNSPSEGIKPINHDKKTVDTLTFTIPSGSYWLSYALQAGLRLFTVVLNNKAFYLSMLTLMLMLILAGFSYEPASFEGGGTLLPKAFILLPVLIYPSLIFTLVAAAFFSIELCDRDKSFRLNQLIDTCPVPTWALMLTKLVAVILMALTLALIPGVSLLVIQFSQGFFDTHWLALTQVTLLVLFPLMLTYGLISIICYAVVSRKDLAQSLAVIICITPAIFSEVKTVENFMYLWAWPFFVQLSDFDASAQYLQRNTSFAIYWLSFYAFLLVVAYWFWPRGTNTTAKARWQEAGNRLKPTSLILSCLFLGTFLWSATDIYTHMIVRNQFQSSDLKHAERADYEKRYGATRSDLQAKISYADLTVDLYPTQRRADYSGKFTLQNKGNELINELVLNYAEFSTVTSLQYNHKLLTPTDVDKQHRRLRFILPTPLAVNATSTLTVELAVSYQGFSNDEFNYHGTIVRDGSYITADLWPSFGYDKTRELDAVGLRHDYGLAKKQQIPSIDQADLVSNLVVSDDADFVISRTKISTVRDQFALASGELVENKQQADRSTYIYENNQYTPWQPQMVSARYQRSQAYWQAENADSAILIEVYHHPDHGANISRIIAAAKRTLQQGHQQWGDFPYQSLRIAEVPNGMTAPQVNGNLVIIPENQTWQHDYRTPPEMDWIEFQIARDVSRIWWQKIAIADVRGHQVLTEGIVILQGLRAIEQKWGESSVAEFVDQISDSYFRQRTTEDGQEASILDLETEEYAAYKATLALYSSYQLLGSEIFDRQLNLFYRNHLDSNRYANAGSLLTGLLDAAPTTNLKISLSQLFNATHYYDFQVESVDISQSNQRTYQLTTKLSATEFIYRAGKDHGVDYQGFATVKVLGGEQGKDVLYDNLVNFEQGQAQLTLQLAQKPTQVIINSQRRLLERSPTNNSLTF